ncbi:hypothetical protein Cgig2_000040 [Carnegiea gigantea]|uniref:BED-type domain-containing protein n=1 Tax=Carnegiea gigantea TaxID=171969 RepID=A0A9Q1L128_9CARY|nr:hypothetical protein Cgig2_000040 [Carnegiea gigantea]
MQSVNETEHVFLSVDQCVGSPHVFQPLNPTPKNLCERDKVKAYFSSLTALTVTLSNLTTLCSQPSLLSSQIFKPHTPHLSQVTTLPLSISRSIDAERLTGRPVPRTTQSIVARTSQPPSPSNLSVDTSNPTTAARQLLGATHLVPRRLLGALNLSVDASVTRFGFERALDIERQGNEIHANENLNSISTITTLDTLVEDDKKRKFLVMDGTNFSDGKKGAKCSYCKKATFLAIAQYGTSNMKKHLEKCKAYQAAKSSEE